MYALSFKIVFYCILSYFSCLINTYIDYTVLNTHNVHNLFILFLLIHLTLKSAFLWVGLKRLNLMNTECKVRSTFQGILDTYLLILCK